MFPSPVERHYRSGRKVGEPLVAEPSSPPQTKRAIPYAMVCSTMDKIPFAKKITPSGSGLSIRGSETKRPDGWVFPSFRGA